MKILIAVLDSIACGDVNRNTMCNLILNSYKEINDYATRISNLLPRTNAYHEIWLDGEKV